MENPLPFSSYPMLIDLCKKLDQTIFQFTPWSNHFSLLVEKFRIVIYKPPLSKDHKVAPGGLFSGLVQGLLIFRGHEGKKVVKLVRVIQ